MKHYPFPLLPGVLAGVITCGVEVNAQPQITKEAREATQRRDASASELVRHMYAALPLQDGVNLPAGTEFWSWDVIYQPQYDTITVQRNQAVLVEATRVINDSPERRPPVMGRPNFTLRIEPLITPQEYARFKAENAATHTQLQEMYEQLRTQKVSHKFSQFLPKNDEEKKKVDAYNKLRSSLHHLPDYYFQNISLSWSLGPASYESLSHSPGETPQLFTSLDDKSKSWEHERAQAVKSMLHLLSRYEPEAR